MFIFAVEIFMTFLTHKYLSSETSDLLRTSELSYSENIRQL
jgi:hypothetical protein